MLDGAMLLWWILTVPSFLFVVVDIWRTTPESNVLKWAFVIITLFTGPIGAFLYVLGCREPLPGTHEQYISARWRQVLGSTMHCVAGDGVGIVVGAAIGAGLALSFGPDFLLEYVLGFGFGWAFFQAFAMRDMAGGSYLTSLRMTFLPELLSMNLLMTGMIVTSRFAMSAIPGGDDPTRPEFWFIMSMALTAGFACAYPINWWLVANHMKHGMLTVRRSTSESADEPAMAGMSGGHDMADMPETSAAEPAQPSAGVKAAMTVFTFAVLGVALWIVVQFAL
ncbi:DUF4396 domain-containing protein [Mycobacterium sp. CVI_P3]|uniref:DUF4396 domain-containing protein n=1 Tax=Mycobacterium pinniadriaticum TaxID=2994102 RepID=A0ABT3SQ00_9MYCO|nr:DUF4396 domain-containing protein [Mycobacterium pinniadriaticum]MCX2934537.1 DUF4396 domain-containing protein [Mycobacterium pinniadriaticum]MCX2940960.1 DUF4396 domain-containing protein [Mycobacterium pinniadriaticum]